jgi:hypothetical protein
MKKSKIYALAIFYQSKILGIPMSEDEKPKKVEFSFTDARYFRDSFSKILKHAETIEKDRAQIVESSKAVEKKSAELKKLFDETVAGVKLDKNLVSRLDKAGVTLSIADLPLFE